MRTTTCCLMTALAMSVSGCEAISDFLFDRGPAFELPRALPERLTRPVAIGLEADTVLVSMDDLQQCRGNAGAAAASGNGWTGKLSDCDYPYTYEVVLAAGSPPGLLVLTEVLPDVLPPEEGEVPFRPLAVVTVTDTLGQSYRFESSAGF